MVYYYTLVPHPSNLALHPSSTLCYTPGEMVATVFGLLAGQGRLRVLKLSRSTWLDETPPPPPWGDASLGAAWQAASNSGALQLHCKYANSRSAPAASPQARPRDAAAADLLSSRLLASPLFSSPHLTSFLVSSRLVSSRLVSSPLVSSRLVSSLLSSPRLSPLSSPLLSSTGSAPRRSSG